MTDTERINRLEAFCKSFFYGATIGAVENSWDAFCKAKPAPEPEDLTEDELKTLSEHASGRYGMAWDLVPRLIAEVRRRRKEEALQDKFPSCSLRDILSDIFRYRRFTKSDADWIRQEVAVREEQPESPHEDEAGREFLEFLRKKQEPARRIFYGFDIEDFHGEHQLRLLLNEIYDIWVREHSAH